MRAYRAAPGAAAALAPLPIVARPLLERAHEALAGLQARLPGSGGGLTESSMSQVAAAGGVRGAGAAGLAKALAICAGTAGGAAVCVSAGVVPAPLGLDGDRTVAPHIERVAEPLRREVEPIVRPAPAPAPEPVVDEAPPDPAEAQPPPEVATSAEVSIPVESSPSPEPAPAPSSAPAASQATEASPAGEFGP